MSTYKMVIAIYGPEGKGIAQVTIDAEHAMEALCITRENLEMEGIEVLDILQLAYVPTVEDMLGLEEEIAEATVPVKGKPKLTIVH